jgi:hypothetical protein
MSCSGLHCGGCAGGMAVPVVPLAAIYGLAWVAEHIIEVAIVSAACGALAVAAVVALMRWQERREARRAASRSIWTVRAEPVTKRSRDFFSPPPPRRELEAGGVHLHFHGLPDDRQAAIIRQALPPQPYTDSPYPEEAR